MNLLSRRAMLAAPLALCALPVRAAAAIQVIYVGGWDCPFCTVWKRDHKAAWLASPEFGRVTYIEVDVPNLKRAYDSVYWKGDLEPVLEQLPKKSGTPRFLIAKGGKLVSNEFGVSKWERSRAALRKLLG
jgi:hypothetical protein